MVCSYLDVEQMGRYLISEAKGSMLFKRLPITGVAALISRYLSRSLYTECFDVVFGKGNDVNENYFLGEKTSIGQLKESYSLSCLYLSKPDYPFILTVWIYLPPTFHSFFLSFLLTISFSHRLFRIEQQ